MTCSFLVLHATRLPGCRKAVITVRVLEGCLEPGLKAATSLAGRKVELTVGSVALVGARRVADEEFTVEVDGAEEDFERLPGCVFTSG